MAATKKRIDFWRPSSETLEAIGDTICAHWSAARTAPHSAFWPKPSNWLRRQTTRLLDPRAQSPQ